MTTLRATILDADFPASKIFAPDFEQALLDGAARLEALLNSFGGATITSFSPNNIDFILGGHAGFMTGIFTPSQLVVNSFFLSLGGGGSITFAGSVDLLSSTETLTSMSINTASVRFGFIGSVTLDEFAGTLSGTMSELHFGLGSFNASLQGNIGVALDGTLTGTAHTLMLDDLSFTNPGAPHDVIEIHLDAMDVALLQAQLSGVTDAQSLLAIFDYSGADDLVLDFKSGAQFDSGAGNDFLQGGRGNDTLDGGSGDDNVAGGTGFSLSVSTGNDSLLGGAGNDSLGGFDGNDTLSGGSGNDVLEGGDGNDLADFAGALGSVAASLVTGLASDGLGGTDDLSGIEALRGGAFADTLTGSDGDETLEGGGGADSLVGGAGNDLYVVSDGAEILVELGGQGLDTVKATVSWTLGANFENLLLDGGNVSGTGNTLDNLITGTAGDNTLDGGGGHDTLIGGGGNDTYVLGVGDVVIDSGGSDSVLSTVSQFALFAGLENLSLAMMAGAALVSGSAAANHIVGNGYSNTLSGGDGNDTVEGGRGDDFLFGGSGADRLDGGFGADVMDGGAGNDVYVVSATRDRIVEAGGGGVDTVEVQAARYALDANVENAVITRAGGSIVTGNALANTIEGGAGADTLTGGLGADRFLFSSSGPVDRITDFMHGVDKIVLDDAVFTGPLVFGTNIEYDAGAGALFYNDVQFATLGIWLAHPAFTATDLQLA